MGHDHGGLDPWHQSIPGVAAHRGGSALAPENTIVGILEGLAAGATHLEVDVRGTADDRAVCFHDATAERTCGEDVPIEELGLEEVRSLDPCSQWSEHAGIATGETEPPSGMEPRHFQVPTLAQVLETFAGVPTIVELKDTAPVDAVVEAIEEGWQRRQDLLFGGFEDELLHEVGDRLPDVPRAASETEGRAFLAGEPIEADALAIPLEREGVRLAEPDTVERAHELGLAVWVWTINDLDQARDLFDMGVDGIVTDHPGKMVRERAARM